MARSEDRMTRAACLATLALLASPALGADPAAAAAQAYTVQASASPAALKVGESGKLSVTISPKTPAWHVHPQAPLKIRIEAPPGLRVERTELGRKDVVDAKAEAPRFETAFVAAAAGAQEAKANVDFFICSDDACVKQTRQVAIPVTVR
jgi:hypothetical protein